MPAARVPARSTPSAKRFILSGLVFSRTDSWAKRRVKAPDTATLSLDRSGSRSKQKPHELGRRATGQQLSDQVCRVTDQLRDQVLRPSVDLNALTPQATPQPNLDGVAIHVSVGSNLRPQTGTDLQTEGFQSRSTLLQAGSPDGVQEAGDPKADYSGEHSD